MKKYLFTFLSIVLVAVSAMSFVQPAQASEPIVACPIGYICTTTSTTAVCPTGYTCRPVVCPEGYTCTTSSEQPSTCPIGYVCGITNNNVNSISTSTSCINLTSNLTVGSTGQDVVILQTFLVSKGFTTEISGYFGSQTKTAVMELQVAAGIPATGFVGPLTRDYIFQKTCAPYTINVTFVSSDVNSTQSASGINSDIGLFSIKFKITAVGNDIYIPRRSLNTESSDLGFRYSQAVSSGSVRSASIVASISGSESGDTNEYYEIQNGVTRTFELTVSSEKNYRSGQVNMTLQDITYTIGSSNGTKAHVALSADEFKTPFIALRSGNNVFPLGVISPNGGEKIALGETLSVEWNSALPLQGVDVRIIDSAGRILSKPSIFDLNPSNENAQSVGFSTTGDQALPLGKYQVRVCVAGTNVCDDSDSYFTIIPAVQNVSPVINGLQSPSPTSVGDKVSVHVSNAGRQGNVILQTQDESKTWTTGYSADINRLPGFSYYDGEVLSFYVPATIGRGVHPDGWWNEPTVSVTDGTYKVKISALDANNNFITSGSLSFNVGTSSVTKIPLDITPVQTEVVQNDGTTANNVGRFLFKFKITAKDQNVYLLTRASDSSKAGVMYSHAVSAGTATWSAALVPEKVGNDTASYFTIPKGTTRQFSVLVLATKDSIPGLVSVTLNSLLARVGSSTGEVIEHSLGKGYTTKPTMLPSGSVSSDSIIFSIRKVDYQITSVNTATSYYQGEMVSFKDLKAINNVEGRAINPTPTEGYNIEAYITDVNDPNPKANLDGINGEFNTAKESWSGVFTKELPSGDYYLHITLYCSNSSQGCVDNGYQDTVRVKFSVKSKIPTVSSAPTVVSARAVLADPIKDRNGITIGYSYQMALKLNNPSKSDVYLGNSGGGTDITAVISPSTASVNYSRDAYPIYVNGDVSGSALILPAGTSRLLNYVGYFLSNNSNTSEVSYAITGIRYGNSASTSMKSILTKGLEELKVTAKFPVGTTVTPSVTTEPSQNPSLSISSPTVGQTLTAGQTYKIVWTGNLSGKDTFNVIEFDASNGKGLLASNLTQDQVNCAGTGKLTCSYTYTLKSRSVSTKNQYAVLTQRDMEYAAYSGWFTVKADITPVVTPTVSVTPTPTPALGVNPVMSFVYPTTGQVFTAGQTYKIVWTGNWTGNDVFSLKGLDSAIGDLTQAQVNCAGVGKITCSYSYTWPSRSYTSQSQFSLSLKRDVEYTVYSGQVTINANVSASPSSTASPAASPVSYNSISGITKNASMWDGVKSLFGF